MTATLDLISPQSHYSCLWTEHIKRTDLLNLYTIHSTHLISSWYYFKSLKPIYHLIAHNAIAKITFLDIKKPSRGMPIPGKLYRKKIKRLKVLGHCSFLKLYFMHCKTSTSRLFDSFPALSHFIFNLCQFRHIFSKLKTTIHKSWVPLSVIIIQLDCFFIVCIS